MAPTSPPGGSERLLQGPACRVFQGEVLSAQVAPCSAAADTADAEFVGFFADEVHHPQLVPEPSSALDDAARGFDSSEYSERAVEPPSAADRVGMGACHEAGAAASSQAADEVAGGGAVGHHRQ